MTTGRYTLHSMQDSGNCYKPRLAMHHLGIPFSIVDVDIENGESRTPDFLALNPNGKVPLLVLPDGRPLAESNAMLCHLAEGSALVPEDPYERACVWQWLFFEQYSHEPQIAVARYWLHLKPGGAAMVTAGQIAGWQKKGAAALGVMERHLERADWFGERRFSIADIALYAYTHVAHQGGFDLSPYPAIGAWLDRVAGLPGHVDIAWRPSNG